MPDLKKIKQAFLDEKIPDAVIAQVDFTNAGGNNPLPVIAAVRQMEALLSQEQCLSIMEKQGCCKGGKRDKDCRQFGKDNKHKPLDEKVALLSTVENMGRPTLNEDGTITAGICWFEGGAYNCACPSIKKLKKPTAVPLTYCGCCAGHFLYHYQNALSVKLKLKEIVSSPLDSNGAKPCTFIFEVVA